jgi:hypothetical protein
MLPVALSMSEMLRVSFKPFAMIIMIGASCAFINPAGFQTNLMVQKDGGIPLHGLRQGGNTHHLDRGNCCAATGAARIRLLSR